MIQYVKGDATQPQGDGPKIITHIVNDQGKWGRGFVIALSRRDGSPERVYRRWFSSPWPSGFYLGAVQYAQFGPSSDRVIVANMVAQQGVRNPGEGRAVRYDALDCALQQVAAYALHMGASIHMPRIGCGLGGGSWDEIEPIIQRTLTERGVAVTVYDL